jgi:tol-pal system protein YbgF
MSSIALRLRAMVGLVPVLVMLVALTMAGCGTSEESTEDWTEPAVETTTTDQPPVSMLEYRIDSLKSETGRLREQLDATSAENRKLTARTAELETQLTDTQAAPKAQTGIADASTSVAPSSSPAYDGALDKFRSHDYEGAIADFQALLGGNVEQGLADNCQYWIGESYYGLKQYKEALKQFGHVLSLDRSSKKADAMFMTGNCQAKLGNAAAAREAFEKVVSEFPTSHLVDKAKTKLASLK